MLDSAGEIICQLSVTAGPSAWLVAGVGLRAESMLWGVFAGNATGLVAALWLGRAGIRRT